MSTFLITVETGRDAAAVPPPLPLHAIAIPVQPYGNRSQPRKGLALSDGVSADRMLQIGNGAVARSGRVQRDLYVAYAKQRLMRSVRIFACFQEFSTEVKAAILEAESAPIIRTDEFLEGHMSLRIAVTFELVPA